MTASTDAGGWILAALAGGVLGLVHFGGLWWTVRAAAKAKHPATLLLVSGLVRMALVLGGFFLAGAGNWRRLVACLVGLVLARLFVMRMARTREPRRGDRPCDLAPTR